MTGPNPGSSSRIFFFILFIRAVLLAVIENLCDSSRAFWSTISSGDHFSNNTGSRFPGRNISSSRFAMEQIWIGFTSSPEKGRSGGVKREELSLFKTHSNSSFSGGETKKSFL